MKRCDGEHRNGLEDDKVGAIPPAETSCPGGLNERAPVARCEATEQFGEMPRAGRERDRRLSADGSGRSTDSSKRFFFPSRRGVHGGMARSSRSTLLQTQGATAQVSCYCRHSIRAKSGTPTRKELDRYQSSAE
nr:hypothetical protein CFP56_02552 [Quercus suber]